MMTMTQAGFALVGVEDGDNQLNNGTSVTAAR
jgi:hypothetical protein